MFKLLCYFAVFLFTLWALPSNAGTCTSISRTNNGANSVLTSTKYNSDLNSAYTAINAFDGGCITDGTLELAAFAAGDLEKVGRVGEVIMWVTETCPTNFLQLDGAAVSRTTYADLYSVIGNAYGEGNGTTTFNVPDMRGKFARGHDDGAGNDPDAASRTACNTGGNTGDNIGSCQDDAFQGHYHDLKFTGTINTGVGGAVGGSASYSTDSQEVRSPITDGSNGTPRTTSETRPDNVYFTFCIRHTDQDT